MEKGIKKLKKNQKGITLLALVVTIIILLILAGVTITLFIGDNGLFQRTIMVSEETKKAKAREELQLMLVDIKMKIYDEEKRNTTILDCEYVREKVDEIKYDQEFAFIEYDTYIFKINDDLEIVDLVGSSNDDNSTGLISSTKYKINKEVLEFSKIAVVGNDEEFETVKEGLDYLYDNGYKDNGAIVLKAGTYDTKDIYTGYSYNIDSKYNEMKVSIIADSPGDTYLTGGEMAMAQINRDYWIELKFYQIIFTTPVYSDAGTKGFHLNNHSATNEYYNCVFIPPVGGNSNYVKTTAINAYNCTFVGGGNSFYESAPLNGIAENCASTNTVIDPKNGTKTTCLTNVTVDSNYNITSEGWKNTGTGTNPDGTQANIGVYGGKYSW